MTDCRFPKYPADPPSPGRCRFKPARPIPEDQEMRHGIQITSTTGTVVTFCSHLKASRPARARGLKCSSQVPEEFFNGGDITTHTKAPLIRRSWLCFPDRGVIEVKLWSVPPTPDKQHGFKYSLVCGVDRWRRWKRN